VWEGTETANPTVQRLMRALTEFGKAEWHQHSFAGCKPSEMRVLFCVKSSAAPEIQVSEIGRRLHVTSPTITQLIKSLEAKGLVERTTNPADRRAVGIVLTAKGEEVTQQAADALAASLHGLMEYLGEEQSNQFVDLLVKVFRYYREKAAWEDDRWPTPMQPAEQHSG
jgi:DNA-binding MarR family transcriptional regulator